MCFEIRKSLLSDLSPALQLDKESFGMDSWTILDYAGVFAFSDVKKFTALVEKKFAGFAASAYDPEKQAVCLMTLAVKQEHRGKGIGTALLRCCENAFAAHHYYLNVDIANQAAIHLYEKEGYRQTGIDHAYYLNGHDAIIMEKSVNKSEF